MEGKFPKIKRSFKAQNLGGWDEIQKKIFDESAILDKIQAKKSENFYYLIIFSKAICKSFVKSLTACLDAWRSP
jgi:hypothetical protein